MREKPGPERLPAIFDELDDLLKQEAVVEALSERGVNASIAMLLADGLRAYLAGERVQAIEDLTAATEEIVQRYAQSARGEA